MYIVSVIVEHPIRHLDMTFSYLSQDEISCGVRVHVPFGYQKIVGYVTKVESTQLTEEKLKQRDGIQYRYISDVIDQSPILTVELEELARALSKMTFTPLVGCLKTMLPPALKPSSSAKMTSKKLKVVTYLNEDAVLTDKQQHFVEKLKTVDYLPLKDCEVSRQMVSTLEKKGVVKIKEMEVMRDVNTLYQNHDQEPQLNESQQEVLNQLFSLDASKPFLLHGITGSGKTEVYLQATKQMVAKGKQVLMLVPEISLTPKMVALFQARFKENVAILHSRLSDGQRYDEYRRILNHEVMIVVGARSAVFAPLNHIGLIILDEEHDQSYKQNNTPRYHTRDIALWRAKKHQAVLLLGSASPSIESYAKAKKGLYHLLEMPYRVNDLPLPACQIVDMTKEAKKGNLSIFSEAFSEGLNTCLSQGKQALILVNRRGYATYLLCKECGYVPKCPHCDVSLTYHKSDQVLRCHYCGYEIPYQQQCLECHSEMVGYKGSGTEQIEDQLAATFPLAKIIRFDMDTTKTKNAHEKLLHDFEKQRGNILLGTQMIAKGLDFKDVTFVGVLDGDSALNIPDFRSAERTFQLLLQVSGRAGRHEKQSEVVIQTYNPYHYAIVNAATQNYQAFYEKEIEARRIGYYPPYCYMVSLLFSSQEERDVALCANQIAKYLNRNTQNVFILGPAPAVIGRINGQFRYRILVKYRNSQQLFPILGKAIKNYHGKVKIEVDVNPFTQL